MSPEDLKILQDRINANKIPKKDRVAEPIEKVAKLASPKKGDKQKGEMELIIKGMFSEYKKEYKFSQTRKFRFDFYIPSLNLGIEYDGLFSDKSRHTTVTGFTGDCDKMNHATILGYKVLRYTSMNVSQMGADLWELKYGKE